MSYIFVFWNFFVLFSNGKKYFKRDWFIFLKRLKIRDWIGSDFFCGWESFGLFQKYLFLPHSQTFGFFEKEILMKILMAAILLSLGAFWKLLWAEGEFNEVGKSKIFLENIYSLEENSFMKQNNRIERKLDKVQRLVLMNENIIIF